MKTEIREQLQKELAARGYKGRMAPHESMWLDDEYLSSMGLGELMDELVRRRERLFRTPDASKESYEDVSVTVDAVRALVDRLGG